MTAATVTGRCYCGASILAASAAPLIVAYCHCTDCRRWTGAPLPAFAAFDEGTLSVEPALGAALEQVPGVQRWSCPQCGSPLVARFAYIPGQIYVPLGLLDQAANLPPGLHCHEDSRLPWLHIHDDLPRNAGSGRDALNAGKGQV